MPCLWYYPHGRWDFDGLKAMHGWKPVGSAEGRHMALLPRLGIHDDRNREAALGLSLPGGHF